MELGTEWMLGTELKIMVRKPDCLEQIVSRNLDFEDTASEGQQKVRNMLLGISC